MKAHHGKNMRVSADVDVRARGAGAPLDLDVRHIGCVTKDNQSSCSPIIMKNKLNVFILLP